MSQVLAEGQSRQSRLQVLPVSLAAMGVVFGDIGTSPLYTMKEVFNGPHAVPVTPDNVLGILSLVFWALTIVVSLKYVVYIMRADNRGEGGIMALTSLAMRTNKSPRLGALMATLGLFGAALFYGDGMITPAISVLSAVEGLEIATPAFRPYVLPISTITGRVSWRSVPWCWPSRGARHFMRTWAILDAGPSRWPGSATFSRRSTSTTWGRAR